VSGDRFDQFHDMGEVQEPDELRAAVRERQRGASFLGAAVGIEKESCGADVDERCCGQVDPQSRPGGVDVRGDPTGIRATRA
jgi:hypothetical protein